MSNVVDVTLGMVAADVRTLNKTVQELKLNLGSNYQTKISALSNIKFEVQKNTYSREQLDIFLSNMLSKTDADRRYIRQGSSEFVKLIEDLSASFGGIIDKKANADTVYDRLTIDAMITSVRNDVNTKVTYNDFASTVSKFLSIDTYNFDMAGYSTRIDKRFDDINTAYSKFITNDALTTILSVDYYSQNEVNALLSSYLKNDTDGIDLAGPLTAADGS